MWKKFWEWYEKYQTENLVVATILFALQVVHLLWLTGHVVMLKLTGISYFPLNDFLESIIVLVDYLEIPSLIGVSLVYINELRQGFKWKPIWYLIFLNSQWLHILWITDEFVVEGLLEGVAVAFPVWLAWVAIGIDYLELPVIWDTIKKALHALREGKTNQESSNA